MTMHSCLCVCVCVCVCVCARARVRACVCVMCFTKTSGHDPSQHYSELFYAIAFFV